MEAPTDTKVIKILLILPFFYPHRGGSQKYAEELYASMIKRHGNVSVDVLAYNTDKTVGYEEYRGMRVFRIPCFNLIPARFALANPISLVLILVRLSRNKYNFVNTHIRFFDTTWWVWLYAKVIHAKSIFTGHVATHPVHQNKAIELVAKIADLTIAKLTLKYYDYITFTNRAAQELFAKKLGVKRPTYLIYGGVDTDFFKPSLSKLNRSIPKLGIRIDPYKTVVCYVGRLIWTKGVTYLYKAIQDLNKAGNSKNTVYILAGPGELEESMKKSVIDDGLGGQVFLPGNLTYEEVRDLLSISDIFVNPSHHNEGFPNTVLEAGASGAYVIATDNAGTKEVILNGQTGSLIPQKDVTALRDSILWALENHDARKEVATRFRKNLEEKFDWKIISDELYDLLIKW